MSAKGGKSVKTLFSAPVLSLCLLAIGPGSSAYAHHSMAGFDRNKTITLVGTVKQFKWANPHAWV